MPLQGGYPLDFYRDVEHRMHFDNGDPHNFFRGIHLHPEERPAPEGFNQAVDHSSIVYNQHVAIC